MRFGATFYKLSGSGNDFVAFDQLPPDSLRSLPAPGEVRALCRRGTGVGADGVIVLRPSSAADYELIYYNADGSRAELCGNASLCSVRLAVELGYARGSALAFVTDAGRITARLRDKLPEIDLAPATEVTPRRDDLAAGGAGAPGEERVGYARVGVPHVVILCADATKADLAARGPALRHHPALGDGANVNFVSPRGDRWAIRTYERGVEAETLACGTGSVATALLLAEWERERSAPGAEGAVERVTELVTSSSLVHRVTLRPGRDGGPWLPSLAGDAAIVFRGELGESA